jgi:Ca2+/Na+ antiporter
MDYLQQIFSRLVGSVKGSGMAVIFVIIGVVGFIVCLMFRSNKYIKVLDD